MLAPLLIAGALAGPLPDPLPEGTTLLSAEESPEFVRYKLHTDRDFYIEITPTRAGAQPVCTGGGYDLWVRLSLEPGESFDWEPLPPVVEATCARLEEAAPTLPEPESAPALPIRVPAGLRPLQALIVPLAALMLVVMRGRAFWGVFALALGVRLAWSPRTILLGGDAPYELLLLAKGAWGSHPRYGDGWAALMSPFVRHLGTDAVHGVGLVASALGAAWLVRVAERLGAREQEAALAGVLLALTPLSLAMAGAETPMPLVVLLQLVAIEGLLTRGPGGDARAVLSTGLLIHLRPEGLAFAVLPLLTLALRRQALATAALGGLFGGRVMELAPQLGQGVALVGAQRGLSPRFVLELLWPHPGAANVWLDPTLVPFLAPWLAIFGLRSARHRPALWLLPLAALAFGVAPTLTKSWPLTDAMRFQLPGLPWLCLWAALGIHALGGRRGLLAGLALVASAALCRFPRYAWSEEYELLRTLRLDPGVSVVYDPFWDENGHFGEWLNEHAGGRWQAREPGPDDWIWVGTADALSGRHYGCPLVPVEAREIEARSDGWVTFPTPTLRIGLQRLACP